MATRKSTLRSWQGALLITLALLGACQPRPASFDGQRAYRDVITQVNFGPRTPGSAAHAHFLVWLQAELAQAGWQVNIQQTLSNGQTIQNIIAYRSENPPSLLLGAHYDSRLHADRDPVNPDAPVPGANDGASGVAVLLELARTLPPDTIPLWLVFFDAEDNGGFPGWEWSLGARAFVAEMTFRPQAVVIVDMVGDADLNLYLERNSDPTLAQAIWQQAAALGYEHEFVDEPKYSILDDHTPFLEAGIPAVDIIDFDYPHWHTTDDTADKVSPQSLEAVGRTLWHWIEAMSKTFTGS